MGKNTKNGRLPLSKLEEERVDVYLNSHDYERGLKLQKSLGTNRSASTGRLNDIHQISPGSSRYIAVSPYMNPR